MTSTQELATPQKVNFSVETEREDDGRWIAEIVEIPGAMTYGSTIEEATAKVQALALRVLAERLEHGEIGPEFIDLVLECWRVLPSEPDLDRKICS